MDFKKNELINETLTKFYESFQYTLDTGDYVPEQFNKKICKHIFKNLKLKFKEIEIYNLLHLQEQGFQIGIFGKLRIYFSGLKPLYLAEKQRSSVVKESADYFLEQKINECESTSALDNETSEIHSEPTSQEQ